MNNHATILQLLEGYNVLEERYVHTVILRLPTGHQVTAELDSHAFKELSRGLNPSAYEDVQNVKQPNDDAKAYDAATDDVAEDEFERGMESPAEESVEEPELTEEQKEALEKPVQWQSLPDDVLAPLMKRAMVTLNLPEVMTLGQVYAHAQSIQENLTNEDWMLLRAQEDQEAAPEKQDWNPNLNHGLAPPMGVQPQTPASGQVTWADGTPIIPGQAASPQRKLQADSRGNPVSNPNEVDPGELVSDGDDVDEEGVPSW